jgi:hypothetical protein
VIKEDAPFHGVLSDLELSAFPKMLLPLKSKKIY